MCLYVLKPSKIDLFTWCGGRGQLEQFALGGGSRHHHHHGRRRRRRHCVSVCLGWMATGQNKKKRAATPISFSKLENFVLSVGRQTHTNSFIPPGFFFSFLTFCGKEEKKKIFVCFVFLLLLFAAPPDLMTVQGKGGGGCLQREAINNGLVSSRVLE